MASAWGTVTPLPMTSFTTSSRRIFSLVCLCFLYSVCLSSLYSLSRTFLSMISFFSIIVVRYASRVCLVATLPYLQ
jgi:hypothetical protein